MARSTGSQPRRRGMIRRRGNSLQVIVYAGLDPVTGKRLYLRDSTTDEAEAQRILTRFRAQVDEQRHARTNATLRFAIEEWLRLSELAESTREGYESYVRLYINPTLGDQPVGKVSARILEQLYSELRRCRVRCDGTPRIDHRTDGPHECTSVRHRRPPGRPPAGGYPSHDCAQAGCTFKVCPPHECSPLSKATISKIHFIISGTLAAAVRWEWITTNAATVARKPQQPPPQPKPPTVEQAGRIVVAAWEEDASWGALVWLVMVTGLRRAELLALRWVDVDLAAGYVVVSRNYVRVRGRAIEKDTKNHRMRRISLDPATVEVLTEHRHRYETAMRQLDLTPSDNAFLFSHEPTCDRPYDPSAVTHRYARMCENLGFDSHLHAMRHYSATELLSSGIDVPAVAGRLGHGGGGATTLRIYTAWLNQADRRPAEILAGRVERPRQLPST